MDGGFRGDIEGMRALAIVAVVLCHAGVGTFAGGYVGVDVFFVISGFLITRLLLGELGRAGTISLCGFYARRARRLLPQSALLLATVAALSIAVFSPVRAIEVSGDVVSSALYTANWHFAARSVDYFAQGHEPSPVLHLWSLAIEEQFYLVWPAALLAVSRLPRRRGRSPRPALAIALVVVCAVSLLLGVRSTDAQPVSAYFSTVGRAWELGLGAALALLGAVAIPRPVALATAWSGLAAILYATFAFDALTPFPGLAALVPTLGAAALLLAGPSIGRPPPGSPPWLLSRAPVRYVGRVSYAWYLWHWPALVFAAAILGPLSAAAGLAAAVASLVPAAITHHLVEDPVRRARSLATLPSRSLALGLGCTAVAIAAGIAVGAAQPTFSTAPAAETLGARAILAQPLPQEVAVALRPSPLEAESNRGPVVADGCLMGIESTRSRECVYGDPAGSHTVILFGDSHAMQYFPPLELLAEERHWRLVVLTKRECTPGEASIQNTLSGLRYSQCDAWRERSLRRIESAPRGAIVVMSGSTGYTAYGRGGETLHDAANAAALEAGYVETLRRIHAAGPSTVLIRDMPASPQDVPSCVSEHTHHLRACAFRRVRRSNREFDVRAADVAPGVTLLDLTPEVCPKNLCRAVIGNALVYRDRFHLTATFTRTLSPWLELALLELIGPPPVSSALALGGTEASVVSG
ncbi:MAG: acyltransferase family protein [Chloroflexota bacterium]